MTILNKQIIIIVLLSIVNFVYGEVEKVEKRTHFSKTYSLGNDRYRVEYSSKPIHYQGSNGNYIDIPLNDSEEYMSIALDQLDETYSSVSGSYQRIERLTSNTYDNSIFSYVGNTLFSVDDSAEEYTDENGNGQWDDAEPLTDIDGNEVWDDDEEFVDENNNGVWDEGESYIDENGNGQYDLAEEYVDTDSSGHWDDAEIFNDTNENGIWDTVVENVVWRNYNQFSNGVLIEPVENGDIYFDEIEIIVDPQYISIPDDTSNFGDISIQAGFIEFGNIFPEPSPNENNWFNLGSMEYNISSFNPAVPLDDDEFRWIINGDFAVSENMQLEYNYIDKKSDESIKYLYYSPMAAEFAPGSGDIIDIGMTRAGSMGNGRIDQDNVTPITLEAMGIGKNGSKLNMVELSPEDFEQMIANNEKNATPETYSMYPSYPNPFNPTTTLKYDIPENSHIKLTVFDLSGRVVTELMNQSIMAGTHHSIWNGKDKNGRSVSSGVYLIQMKAISTNGKKHFTNSQKIVLLK